MSYNNSLMMVLLYLVTGLGFGHGLVMLLVAGVSALPLAMATWLAAAVLLMGNYRRLTRQAARG